MEAQHRSPQPAASDSRHIPALDGLRGLAILLVVVHNAPYFPTGPHGVVWLAAIAANAGWIGVQLFFVLSGFLITRQLLDSQPASNYYRAFYPRRVLRIFPLYYTALLLGLVIPFVFPGLVGGAVPHWDQIWLWLFLFNWAAPLGVLGGAFAHFWSLAVEEQFYLIWPFVVRKAEPRGLFKLCAWIALAALAIRSVMRAAGANTDMLYAFTFCRMDALVIGAGVAVLLRIPSLDARARALAPGLIPFAILLALAGALLTHAYERSAASTQTFGYSILAVSAALLMLASLVDGSGWNRWLQAALATRALRSVGRYSFGMYVIHYPIILVMGRFVPRFREVFGSAYIFPLLGVITLLSYAAAFVSFHALEKHFLRMKRFFVPTRVNGPAFETGEAA